jgi:hypothetical protein
MATLANSTTHIQWAPNIGTHTLGQSSSTNRTVYRGQPAFIGTDADSNTERVVDIDDISGEAANCIILTATADVAYTNNVMSVAYFPCRILTNNVASGAEPAATADNRVYIDDSGQFSNADGGSAGHSYGSCVDTRTIGGVTFYDLNLTGRDET